MGGGVDSPGEAADDRHTPPAQIGGETPGHPDPVGRRAAGSDHRDRQGVLPPELTPDQQERGREGNRLEGERVVGVGEGDEVGPHRPGALRLGPGQILPAEAGDGGRDLIADDSGEDPAGDPEELRGRADGQEVVITTDVPPDLVHERERHPGPPFVHVFPPYTTLQTGPASGPVPEQAP